MAHSIFNPLPPKDDRSFSEIPPLEVLANVYHFFGGYLGTLDRYKLYKEYRDKNLTDDNVRNEFNQALEKIENNKHFGIFDARGVGALFYGIHRLLSQPEIIDEQVCRPEEEGYQRISTKPKIQLTLDIQEKVTLLFAIISDLSAISRAAFAVALTVPASLFVGIAYGISKGIAKFKDWRKRKKGIQPNDNNDDAKNGPVTATIKENTNHYSKIVDGLKEGRQNSNNDPTQETKPLVSPEETEFTDANAEEKPARISADNQPNVAEEASEPSHTSGYINH